MQNKGNTEAIKLDKTTATLEPDKSSGGGLFVPGKDRVVYRPPERKSLLGKISYFNFLILVLIFVDLEKLSKKPPEK